jgi:hypothetical protein
VRAGLPRKSCQAEYGKFVVTSVGLRRCRSSRRLKKMLVCSCFTLAHPSSSSYVTRNVIRTGLNRFAVVVSSPHPFAH